LTRERFQKHQRVDLSEFRDAPGIGVLLVNQRHHLPLEGLPLRDRRSTAQQGIGQIARDLLAGSLIPHSRQLSLRLGGCDSLSISIEERQRYGQAQQKLVLAILAPISGPDGKVGILLANFEFDGALRDRNLRSRDRERDVPVGRLHRIPAPPDRRVRKTEARRQRNGGRRGKSQQRFDRQLTLTDLRLQRRQFGRARGPFDLEQPRPDLGHLTGFGDAIDDAHDLVEASHQLFHHRRPLPRRRPLHPATLQVHPRRPFLRPRSNDVGLVLRGRSLLLDFQTPRQRDREADGGEHLPRVLGRLNDAGEVGAENRVFPQSGVPSLGRGDTGSESSQPQVSIEHQRHHLAFRERQAVRRIECFRAARVCFRQLPSKVRDLGRVGGAPEKSRPMGRGVDGPRLIALTPANTPGDSRQNKRGQTCKAPMLICFHCAFSKLLRKSTAVAAPPERKVDRTLARAKIVARPGTNQQLGAKSRARSDGAREKFVALARPTARLRSSDSDRPVPQRWEPESAERPRSVAEPRSWSLAK